MGVGDNVVIEVLWKVGGCEWESWVKGVSGCGMWLFCGWVGLVVVVMWLVGGWG